MGRWLRRSAVAGSCGGMSCWSCFIFVFHIESLASANWEGSCTEMGRLPCLLVYSHRRSAPEHNSCDRQCNRPMISRTPRIYRPVLSCALPRIHMQHMLCAVFAPRLATQVRESHLD